MAKQSVPAMRTPEEHYQAGVAMMNLGRWDEARRSSAARAQAGAEGRLRFLRDGGAGLSDRGSRIGDGKFKSRDFSCVRKPLPRPQRRGFRVFCRKIPALPNCFTPSAKPPAPESRCAASSLHGDAIPMKKRTRQPTVAIGGVRIVAIGGGTGLSMLLRGLKHFVARRRHESERHPIRDLAAIVTVTDDGEARAAAPRIPRASAGRHS